MLFVGWPSGATIINVLLDHQVILTQLDVNVGNRVQIGQHDRLRNSVVVLHIHFRQVCADRSL